MFAFKNLLQVQVEITNKCQASCPMCLRNVHGGIDNPLLQSAEWTLGQFMHIFNLEVLSQIKHINFCGDFGDPMLNNELIDMCRYIKDNSTINIPTQNFEFVGVVTFLDNCFIRVYVLCFIKVFIKKR